LVLFALVFSSFYKGYLADYYLAFIFPIPILLFANLLRILTRKVKFLHGTMAILILGLSVFNLKNLPFRTSARSINQQREVASIITNDVSSTEKFNLFLKRETPFWSTASEYRYLVEVMGKRALEPTSYKNSEVVYFIAEIPVSEPLKVGDWEIKEFGPKKIEKTWELPKEVFIYKMRR